jgi:glutamate synthase domain-containing protein 1/glutamate synthase domain-containing protein 3
MSNKSSLYRKARKNLTPLDGQQQITLRKEDAAEGGCGVVGLLASEPLQGKHLYTASYQMRNRGNGKGGGIAMLGLVADEIGVSDRIINEDFILQIAYLDPACRKEIETEHLFPFYQVDQAQEISTIDDHRDVDLEVRPPDVVRYFVRPKTESVQEFAAKNEIREFSEEELQDEYVFQRSYGINRTYYASLGDKRAFVMSHAKNLVVFKAVGFAEQVIQYYKLSDSRAHGWIAHQRYPTKGRVWHPGGAHPFIGMHEALVHNGDFANYFGVCEYLKQNGLHPLFLTDTEVSVLLFDLLSRSYGYPLEWVIEAMAPTTERDFLQLPEEKKSIYKALQMAHLNGSPDGPWFFIIARNDVKNRKLQMIGITDTSMLRPQVFALHDGAVQIGLIASEKQAIDAALGSLASEDQRVCPVADRYWNARGGSYTDGGAFKFSVDPNDRSKWNAQDKFGRTVELYSDSAADRPTQNPELLKSLEELTQFYDLPPASNGVSRKWHLAAVEKAINEFLDALKAGLPHPATAKHRPSLIIDATKFAAEGPQSLALHIVKAYQEGFRHIIVYRCRGHRFIGCGIQANSEGLKIEVYGSSGDYLASGLDGAEIIVHGNGQDQIGQIFNKGRLVVYGDVGQTFFYGAKGGEAYILGNAAGRPLINAVGSPRVVINGTCLDYLGESFMAGDPLNGGGFVILNGIRRNELAEVEDLPTPYPGGNLFSLASGGAIYVRDPRKILDQDQLNGGRFESLSTDDWNLILPYLEKNEQLFGIRTQQDLLRDSKFDQVYRKIIPAKTGALH